MITGTIYGLDLGTRMGCAYGAPGATPRWCSVTLKKPSEHRAVAFANLLHFLVDRFERHTPALVAKEKMLHTAALLKLSGGNDDNMRMHAGLHAVVEAVCGRYGVSWTDVACSTARVHFIGKSRLGTREETKAAVVARCHLLGLTPAECNDDNVADAVATHDWACATYGRRAASTKELFFWNEQQRAGAA